MKTVIKPIRRTPRLVRDLLLFFLTLLCTTPFYGISASSFMYEESSSDDIDVYDLISHSYEQESISRTLNQPNLASRHQVTMNCGPGCFGSYGYNWPYRNLRRTQWGGVNGQNGVIPPGRAVFPNGGITGPFGPLGPI